MAYARKYIRMCAMGGKTTKIIPHVKETSTSRIVSVHVYCCHWEMITRVGGSAKSIEFVSPKKAE